MTDIFISYANADIGLARLIATNLIASGWNVWWDEHIPPGTEYDVVISSQLEEAKCVIVLWTEKSIYSKNVKDEANEALIKKKLVPIQVGSVRPPLFFRMIQTLLWPEKDRIDKEAFNDLLSELASYVLKPSKDIELPKASLREQLPSKELKGMANSAQSVSDEEAFWEKALQEDSISGYKNYQKIFKKGKYYATSMAMIGMKYHYGVGVDTDIEKAFDWFTKAADDGDADADVITSVGLIYENEGCLRLAMQWYLKAAEAGNVAAMNNIGLLYQYGEVPNNFEKVLEWFSGPAKKEGITQDFEKAFEWFSRAAKLGDYDAICNLGNLYQDGQGVERDLVKALTLFRKAAKAGHAVSMNNLGTLYQSGVGVLKDLDKAINWYTKAANAGNVTAMENLAKIYESGEGVKDKNKAMTWRRKAEFAADKPA